MVTRWLAVLATSLMLTGCLTGVVRELAKDPSTSCVELQASYLVAALNLKWFRTQQPGKSECSRDGMKNDAGTLPKLP